MEINIQKEVNRLMEFVEQRGIKDIKPTKEYETVMEILSKGERGAMVVGGIGCGKTTMMRLFGMAFGYRIKSTRHILRDFDEAQNPASVVSFYGRDSYRTEGMGQNVKHIVYCLDDLGAEKGTAKSYGNDWNVMEEILQDRYEEWAKNGLLTHITTNLEPEQIAKKYGERTLDRLREMCQLVVMEGDSFRKNKNK